VKQPSPSTYPEMYDGRSVPRASRGPACCSGHGFATCEPYGSPVTATEAPPRRGEVVTGSCLRLEAEDFPRHHPPSVASSLNRGSRCGLRRYERVFTRGRPRAGQFTYPTRNFATLGTLVTPASLDAMPWPDHFCLAPHVAMRVGLYLRLIELTLLEDARRAVSEDPAIAVSC
jgi:hypothetical protein